MPAPAALDPNPNPTAPDPTQIPDGPPEEEFWDRYNKRLEFPLSSITAVLIHVIVAAFLVATLNYFMKKEDRSGVPISLVPDMNGLDDAGLGSAGSGGIDSLKEGDATLADQLKLLPDPNQLPVVIQNLKDTLKYDNEGDIAVSPLNAPQYSLLDETLKKKMLGIGAPKGVGGGAGRGDDGKGSGTGGTGADSTRARSLRWVMRFRTNDGQDYLAQLAAMEAVILVPIPPNNKDCLYFKDLKNPSRREIIQDGDLGKLVAGQIKFCDTRPGSVRGVCDALGVKEDARSFWAFFPKKLEAELDRKERGYRNRRSEEIEETIFRVVARGAGFDIIVDDQTPKR